MQNNSVEESTATPESLPDLIDPKTREIIVARRPRFCKVWDPPQLMAGCSIQEISDAFFQANHILTQEFIQRQLARPNLQGLLGEFFGIPTPRRRRQNFEDHTETRRERNRNQRERKENYPRQ